MVSFRHRFSPSELREVVRAERGTRWGWRVGQAVGVVVLLLSGYTLYKLPGQAVLQIPLLMVAAALLCAGRFQDYGAFLRMRRDPVYREDVGWTIDGEGLRWQGETFRRDLPWAQVARVLETRDGFVVQPEFAFYWISKSWLSSEDIDRLRGCVPAVKFRRCPTTRASS